MRRALLALLLTVGFTAPGFLFTGCDNCDCPRFDATVSYMLFKNIDRVTQFALDGQQRQVALKSFDTVAFGAYASLLAEFEVEYIAMTEPESGSRLSLMPSAYACSCNDPRVASTKEQRYASIDIRTLYDFDGARPAGTSVYSSFEPSRTIDTGLIESQFLQFKLLERPVANDTFQVEIDVLLSDGQRFTERSAPIIFVE